MTLRITFGVDPGVTGAIAVLADGEPVAFIDMPTYPRPSGRGREVDPYNLADRFRDVLRRNHGAHAFACLEEIAMRPENSRGSDQSTGVNLGIIKGVLGALGISWSQVRPQTWKKWADLIGTEKDAARLLAQRRYPNHTGALARKKDQGRADALLIARWAWETEQHAEPAFALKAGAR